MGDDIRKTAIAGSWYPSAPEVLRKEIRAYFDSVSLEPVKGKIIGLVAPHAGYMYSGNVAAYAYRTARGQTYDTVIVIGPAHRASFRGVSVFDKGGYETPLGVVPVDVELARSITSTSAVVSSIPSVHNFEHSIEIQLPFLQVALGEFRFVPLLMGDQDEQTCEKLAQAIIKSVGESNILVVGSSDLSHFHPYETAVRLDKIALRSVERMDAAGLLGDLKRHACEACGGGPMAVTMMVSKQLGADSSRLLRYANSGDVTGDRSSVVGYAAVVFSDSSADQVGGRRANGASSEYEGLTGEEKRTLLKVARKTIESRLAGKDIPEIPIESEKLKEKRGSFVTIKKHGKLRGCIGYIEAVKPLHVAVEEMALSAAFGDPRFHPVTPQELDELDLEISVLSPLTEVKDINDIQVGRHGIYIVKGFYSGLLLPQVATEYNWDRMTFLRETCRKAGLPPQAWKDKDTRVYVFSADVFGEEGL